ncbi:MAG: aldo/keto reductase [Pelobium sp.]
MISRDLDANFLVEIAIPKVILGTSSLKGNLYSAIPYSQKLEIVKAGMENSGELSMFDTAGKYGAGLALETLGKCLRKLRVAKNEVIISNKLGWLRKPLITPKPTFEEDVWIDIAYDAYQNISFDRILECFEQGNELLEISDAFWDEMKQMKLI